MVLPRLVGWAKGHRDFVLIVALLLLFAGVDLLWNVPKDAAEAWFSTPLIAVAVLLFALLAWPTVQPGPRPIKETLAHRLLWRVTWSARLVPAFRLFGILIVIGDLAYNRAISSAPSFGEHDFVVFFLGIALLAYRFVPARYERERDFVFLFLVALALILVVPLLIARVVIGDLSRSVDLYSSVALAPETAGVLSAIGVPTSVVFLPNDPPPGLSLPPAHGLAIQVYITTSCSGIYSTSIFASAFAAFVLTEQKNLTARVALFFSLGVFLAYAANILRMVVIVLISHAYDTPATGAQSLLVAHNNVGWMIFLLWIGLFWVLLFRFLPPEPSKPLGDSAIEGPKPRRGTFCGICGIVLTPAILATRCECARFYHAECLREVGKCPNCNRPPPTAIASQVPTL